jgi:hypothetical protein
MRRAAAAHRGAAAAQRDAAAQACRGHRVPRRWCGTVASRACVAPPFVDTRVCAGAKPADAPASPYEALRGKTVFRPDGAAVQIDALWSAAREQPAVVVFLRSFG